MFAIAVATSSVNFASRASVWPGSVSGSPDPALISPHSAPSTTIGTPTAQWISEDSRMTSAIVPWACE